MKAKFRAWDKVKKIMWDSEEPSGRNMYWHIEPNGYVDVTDNNVCRESLDFVLMQFTGLKDKKGKEIYEGDILKNNSQAIDLAIVNIGEYLESKEQTYYGIYIKLSDGNEYGLSSQETEFAEVIGNKFENPELLEDLK